MNFSLLTQIGLIAITVFIAITYIKPTLGEIDVLQDNIFEYEEAVEQAIELNTELADLVEQANSISVNENRALFTYMPDQVDEIAVLKDLELIVTESGLLLGSVGASEGSDSRQRRAPVEEVVDDSLYDKVAFSIVALGDYRQFKNLLSLLAQNDYPLHVTSLDVEGGGGETSILNFSLTVETYSLLTDEEVTSSTP